MKSLKNKIDLASAGGGELIKIFYSQIYFELNKNNPANLIGTQINKYMWDILNNEKS